MERELNVICTYTRKQAIDDNVLYDVSTLARSIGFKYPVAMTAGLLAEIGSPYSEVGRTAMLAQVSEQELNERIHTLLIELRVAIKNSTREDSERTEFVVKYPDDHRVSCYAVCGPGDDQEPVITIMLPNED